MKRVVLCAMAVAFLLSLVGMAATEVVLFYEEGCPHCARMEALLQEMQAAGAALTVKEYNVASQEGRDLLPRLLAAYGAEMGPVPFLFVADTAIVRDTLYRAGSGATPVVLAVRAVELEARAAIDAAIAANAPSPLDRLPATATEAVLILASNCPDCDRLDEWMTSVQRQHPELAVRRVSADDEEGKKTLDRLARLYRARSAVPALFVGDTALLGATVYPGREKARTFAFSDEDTAFLSGRVQLAIDQKAPPPLDRVRVREKATLWAVIGSAALDSINPCDFAVMLLLLGRLLVIGRRQKVIWAGLAWSAGVYIVYFMMGYVFYTLLGVTVGTRSLRVPYIITVSVIAILMGLWQMKDLLWYGKWFSIEVPAKWKPVLTRVTNSVVSLPGVFVAGLIDALFLAPCTSGPYLAILSLLSTTTTRTQGVLLLLLYNLIFILPMIAIALTVHFGITTTARAERWRTARMGKLHFVTGVVMVLLGVGMIIGVQLGYI
ncbi:MAG: cytochrome c biogenesis protein CcdA [Thermotogota bacterium]